MAGKAKEEQEEQEEQEEEQEVQKIKVGDTEFSPEELEGIVGKARSLQEFEEKQGQSWEEVATSWGKRGERIGEYKKKEEDYKKQLEEYEKKLASQGETLTDDQKKQAKALIKELVADEFMTKEDYQKFRAGEKMYSQVRRTLRWAKERGYPQASEEKLLEYMADPNNPKDPRNAYELMFKKEIREVDAKKVEGIKPKGMQTDTTSTAGGKEFKPPKVTKENLRSVLKEHFQQAKE